MVEGDGISSCMAEVEGWGTVMDEVEGCSGGGGGTMTEEAPVGCINGLAVYTVLFSPFFLPFFSHSLQITWIGL